MRKKVLSAVLAATMVAGMMGNVVSVSAEEKYDLTLYSVNTTDPDFDDWLANVEEATGLNINVIAAPTDTDTRQQKITTILSTGDSSVDIVEINDEMSAAFKNSGWLEGLNDTVMTDDIIDQFAQGYIQDMITDKDGNIVGVPGYTGYLAFWVNQEIMDEVGIESIDTKEDFMKYMEAVSKDGRFGYGGSWEKTYASNEIAQFVNMFGGDYFDWTKEENKEAIQFLHDLVANKETPVDQIADKYDQMNPKINDGKYGCWFMWGLGTDYAKAVSQCCVSSRELCGLGTCSFKTSTAPKKRSQNRHVFHLLLLLSFLFGTTKRRLFANSPKASSPSSSGLSLNVMAKA